MAAKIDFDAKYLDVLEKAVDYFNHSSDRLTGLSDSEKTAIKNYLASDAAKNNPDLKRYVISALKDGLKFVQQPGDENKYQTGDKASLLLISGALGSYSLIDTAIHSSQEFAGSTELKATFANAVVADFSRFKTVFADTQFTDTLYFKDKIKDHNRLRPIFSGIDQVLKNIGEELRVTTIVDNMLDRELSRESIANNPGGVRVIALALTPQQARELHHTGANKDEAAKSAINFAKNFHENLLRNKSIEITLFNRAGKMIYHRDKEHDIRDIKALAAWHKSCTIIPTAEIPVNTAPAADDICNGDGRVRQQKEKLLKRMTWGNVLGAIQSITGMFGGPLWQAGLTGLALGIGGVGQSVIGVSGLAALGTPAGIALLVITAIGGAFSLTNTAINYYSAEHFQKINFDTMLVGTAHSTKLSAKTLVNELKANNLCLTENTYEQNCRQDGKEWVQATQPTGQPEHQRG